LFLASIDTRTSGAMLFPFTVSRGRDQPLWIEVFIPPVPGLESIFGTANVSSGGEVQFSVRIHLTVWSFNASFHCFLKSSFGLKWCCSVETASRRYTDDQDLYAITRVYAKAALLHRIKHPCGSMVPPKDFA